ncbi:MAG: S-methyl-5'-thioadenosine phosphorylase [Candidatus Geothermarchaeales archaeon]
MTVGLICGSGFEELMTRGKRDSIKTPYGDVDIKTGRISRIKVVFIPRHGFRHEKPPQWVNYRGNVYALRKQGVEKVVATGAVGSLNALYKPGDLVLIDQFIDLTKRRPSTFYEDEAVHVDATDPYCPILREALLSSGRRLGLRVWDHGTYVCTEGPRFETRAEIKFFDVIGGDVVGMTNLPEVVLARELGLCYATIAVVTNWAAGIQERVSMEEVYALMDRRRGDVKALLREALPKIDEAPRCPECRAIDAKASELMRKLEGRSPSG